MSNTSPHPRARGGKCAVLFVIGMFASALAARAQNKTNPSMNPWDRLVCPLSDSQQQNAIDAFAKMVPTFHHKRCQNCHGAVNPFASDGNHGGGPVNITEDQMEQGACNQCHNNLPPVATGKSPVWKLPVLPDHSFVGKDAKTLCEMMRRAFPDSGIRFEFHILNDNDKTNFQMISFLGTRGLFDVAPEPIEGLTPGQFFDQAVAWVEAMGGDFKGDERCGCEPVHFAVQGYYTAALNIGGLVQGVTTMGPVRIPIIFHDDGSFEGTGTLPLAGMDTAGPCKGQSQGSMQVKVSGKAVEQWQHNQMHIELTNTSRATGPNAVQCPIYSGVFQLRGGDKMTFGFDVSGKDGDESTARVPLPGPGINATVHVKVVDLNAPAAPR